MYVNHTPSAVARPARNAIANKRMFSSRAMHIIGRVLVVVVVVLVGKVVARKESQCPLLRAH